MYAQKKYQRGTFTARCNNACGEGGGRRLDKTKALIHENPYISILQRKDNDPMYSSVVSKADIELQVTGLN